MNDLNNMNDMIDMIDTIDMIDVNDMNSMTMIGKQHNFRNDMKIHDNVYSQCIRIMSFTACEQVYDL